MDHINAINQATKLLLVTPDFINVDSIAATFTLARLLNSLGKTTTILTHKQNYSNSLAEDFSSKDLDVKGKIQSNDFVLDIPIAQEIDDVELEKDGEKYRFRVKTKSGQMKSSKVNFQRDAAEFDLIILLGIQDFEISQEFYLSFGTEIKKSQTMLIHYIDSSITTNYKYILSCSSLSEAVFSLASQFESTIKPNSATDLLSGILWNTQNLKINSNKKTVENVNQLVQTLNANLHVANKRCNFRITKDQMIWNQEVFLNLKIENNLVYSIVSNSNITQDFISSFSEVDKVPIHRIQGCDVALVIVKLHNISHGFIQTNVKRYSALKLSDTFNQIGDNVKAHFWTDKDSVEIINLIKTRMSNIDKIASAQSHQSPVSTTVSTNPNVSQNVQAQTPNPVATQTPSNPQPTTPVVVQPVNDVQFQPIAKPLEAEKNIVPETTPSAPVTGETVEIKQASENKTNNQAPTTQNVTQNPAQMKPEKNIEVPQTISSPLTPADEWEG